LPLFCTESAGSAPVLRSDNALARQMATRNT
jgi:hypothetical protein